MFRFITAGFAIIGFLLTVLVIAIAVVAFHSMANMAKEPASVVLTLDFDKPVKEQEDNSPIALALDDEEPETLFNILHAIDNAKGDHRVKAIVAHFGTLQPSLAQAQEIRAALARFRSSGKPTYAFGADYGEFGMGNRSYYLASAFDSIWLQPVGTVGLSGIAIQSPFGKAALDKIGVTADFMQREEYKSFMEMGERDSMSDPVKQMTQGMINDFSDQISSGIAESRKWDQQHVKDLMASGPYTATEALKNGLVTHVGYADELQDELDGKFGKDTKEVSVSDYLGYANYLKKLHVRTDVKPAKVAIIYGEGLIADHDVGNSISGDHVMTSDSIADAFDDAAKDKDVRAIIFRVDSPGGSPEASETIRRAMIHAQKQGKPVIVSMGDMAASGGYWVSMNADEIIAEPGTITGSIGVVGGKFVIGGLLQKLGINFETLKTTDSAGMWAMTDMFSPLQRERVNTMLDETYHDFVQNVSDARKIPMDKMPDIAKGRVWTGAQAVKIGLVDQLGGYDVTLAEVRKKLKLSETDLLSLEPFPEPESPAKKILKALKSIGIDAVMVGSAATQWQHLTSQLPLSLNDMGMDGHPVMARVPSNFLQPAQ